MAAYVSREWGSERVMWEGKNFFIMFVVIEGDGVISCGSSLREAKNMYYGAQLIILRCQH